MEADRYKNVTDADVAGLKEKLRHIQPELNEHETSVLELMLFALEDLRAGRVMTADEWRKKLGR